MFLPAGKDWQAPGSLRKSRAPVGGPLPFFQPAGTCFFLNLPEIAVAALSRVPAACSRFCASLALLIVFSARLTAGSRAGVAFSPGFLTAQAALTSGVSAEWELPLAAGLALRADTYALLAQPRGSNLLQNYQALFGLVYSFEPLGRVEPFAGFQPGLGISEVDTPARAGLYVYPAMSPFFGARLALNDWLDASLVLRYVFGELHYRATGAVYLSELRIAAGFSVRL